MRSFRVVLTVATAFAAGLVAGAAIPDCAISCYENPISEYSCEDWETESSCCNDRYYFVSAVGSCLIYNCEPSEGSEAWSYLEETCANLDAPSPWTYNDFMSAAYGSESSSASSTTESTLTETELPSTTTISEAAITTTTSAEIPTLPTLGSVAETPTVATSTEITAVPTLRSATTTPTHSAGQFGATSEKRSGLSTGAKVAIGVGIPVVVLGAAVILFLFFRRKQQKNAPGTETTTDTQSSETRGQSMTFEISGKEISRMDDSNYRGAELGSLGSSALPVINNDSNSTIPEMSPNIVQHRNPGTGRGILSAKADPASSSCHSIGDTLTRPQIPQPPASSVSPIHSQLSPIRPLSSLDPRSHRGSLAETSPIVPTPDEEVRGLISNLDEMERQRTDRASRLQLLQEEEAAILAEEVTILDEIRRRTVERAESPGHGASPR
ncbi:hypothetical protein FQN53_006588 [Emmonsiellopsis sp. PD_33]|nr:hypothetical protein FQN53_006588 [Emmonsiellopsis sp. PD_33]